MTQNGVAPQRSSAAETCHTFTKVTAGAALRSLAFSGSSATAVWLYVLDAASAPLNNANVLSALLIPPLKVGSDGSAVNATIDFSSAPELSANGFTACLATGPGATYVASSATVIYTGQVQ